MARTPVGDAAVIGQDTPVSVTAVPRQAPRRRSAPSRFGDPSLFEPDILDDEEEKAQDEHDVAAGMSAAVPRPRRTPFPRRSVEAMSGNNVEFCDHSGTSDLAPVPGISAAATDPDAELDFLDQLRLSWPHLVARYLERGAGATKRSRDESSVALPVTYKRGRYEFAPSPQQELVHGVITGAAHQGTSGFSFVEFLMAYAKFRFRIYPGVLVRVYDFQFGARGLSVLHFKPLGFKEGFLSQLDATVSMTDFSASAKILPPPEVTSWTDLSSSRAGLVQYCVLCCDETTQNLVRALQSFVGEAEQWQLWGAKELPLLTLWINSILAKYRAAVIADGSAGSNTRLTISTEFSVFNPQLQALLASVLADLIASDEQSTPKSMASVGPRVEDRAVKVEHRAARSERRVSAAVLSVLPRQQGKELCLRNLSKRGCQSSDAVRCVNPKHYHSRPPTLPQPVITHVKAQFGGLCEQYQSMWLSARHTRSPPASTGAVRSSSRCAAQQHRLGEPIGSSGPPRASFSATPARRANRVCHSTPVPSAQGSHTCEARHAARSPGSAMCSSRSIPGAQVKPEVSPAQLRRLPTYDELSQKLLFQLRRQEAQTRQRLLDTLRSHDISLPCRLPPSAESRENQLDYEPQRALSSLIRMHGYTLDAVAELVRGQNAADYRPNKALRPDHYRRLLAGYKHQKFLLSVALSGITPLWSRHIPPNSPLPANHKSATRHLDAVLKSIRRGHDAGQYLVLEEDVLPLCGPVQISPLGAVEKHGVDASVEVRVIHDLSHPKGSATNDASLREHFPTIEYHHVAAVARRIEYCHLRYPHATIWIMKGDVKGAFRHLMLTSAHVRWMAARIPEKNALVFDLAAPFGWTCSPTCYGAFGGAITWLLGRESPASMSPLSADPDCFFAYEWVDDHVLVEPGIANRLFLADQTLRLAMLAVLGPKAVNEDKFSKWSTRLEVLGLEFNTRACTLSMPLAKISKALSRV